MHCAAAASSRTVPLPAGGVLFRVVHSPFVYVRAEPSTLAPMVSVLTPGALVRMDAERDGWLRMRDRVKQGRLGWSLKDGAPIGLGMLLVEVES